MRRASKRRIAFGVAIVLWITNIPFTVQATSTLDKLNQAQKDKNQTESQLDQTNQQIDGLEGVKDGLQGELNTLSGKLKEVSNNLEDLEQQIEDKMKQIEETQKDLEEAKERENIQYQSMKRRICFLYERGDSAYMEMIFSAGSFADILNKTEYVNLLAEYDHRMLLEYKATKKQIEEDEAQLLQDKKDLDAIKVEVEEQQKQVASSVSQTSNNIAGYADQIASAETQALAIEDQLKKQEADIAALKKQYEQELALSKLAAQSAKRDISEISFAEGDLTMLAAIIYCEAGGEPYAGKLGVGAVVINRLLSSRYPNTITGVIYQNKQFSPVGSGRFELALAGGKATQSCYQAAQEAMNGVTNVGGCVYFRTPIEGLTGLQIGGHIFY